MAKKENARERMVFSDKIITLRSVYDKSNIVYHIQPCKDKYGRYPSCVKRVDANGDMILSEQEKNDYAENKAMFFPETHMFTITTGKTYNLLDYRDKAEWEAIRHCPLIAKDRNEKDENGNLIIDGPISTPSKPARNGVAELYVDRPDLEVVQRVDRKRKVHNACAYVYNDPKGADGQLMMARILGKDMRNRPNADVVDYLIRIAEKDPDKIVALYTGGDTSLRILFLDAKDKQVIQYKNKLYFYGDTQVLGSTDDAVITWMKDAKNQKMLELIRKDTYPDTVEKA